ncbi:MAG: hypothetical protein K2I47_01245 [Odoribacter sp.]|nr:hypothetical protein [Odoribacter sp.]
MELTNSAWKTATSKIFLGVLLFSLSGIAGGILAALLGLVLKSLTLVGIIVLIAGIAAILGYVLYVLGLGNFKNILSGEDAAAVSKVWLAALLALAGSVITVLTSFIPGIAIIGTIAAIAAYVLNLLGFMALKNSSTFPTLAKAGANKLFLAYILYLAGSIAAFFLPSFIAGLINLVALVMIILGWSAIKNANVEA